jgi:hypothetical protein
MAKNAGASVGSIVTVLIPIVILFMIVDTVGWLTVIAAVVVGIVLLIFLNSRSKKQHRKALAQKYGSDLEIFERIIGGTVWMGETAEQLTDSIGYPVAVDRKILKTKIKEIWKYDHLGNNRFAMRVTLENDIVVGWDQKDA